MAKQNDNHTEKTFTCSECGRTYKDHAGLHKWNSNYHDSFIRCRVDGAVCMEDKKVETQEPEVPVEDETDPREAEGLEDSEDSDLDEVIRPDTSVDEEGE